MRPFRCGIRLLSESGGLDSEAWFPNEGVTNSSRKQIVKVVRSCQTMGASGLKYYDLNVLAMGKALYAYVVFGCLGP